MKKLPLFLLPFCLIVLMAHDVRAQTDEEFSKCIQEAKVMCHGVTQGQGRIMRCLANSREKLSLECRKVVDKYVQ